MGDGPCGPNTEIYFDFYSERELPKSIEELDNKRFIEICNIVFPEFYHKGEEYLPLAEKCVDTGAGLERIAMVLQGLQILLDIQVDKKNPMPLDKIFRCEIEEGQKVSRKTTLFIVYLEEQIISVTVYVPWQPEIIGGVEKMKKGNKDCFVKIHYRNPYSTKLNFKRHGKY
nr:11828_t:CDS:2 [Entrophospora candida]